MTTPLQLVAGIRYEAEDFEKFEYLPPFGRGTKAILRLHMKNGTIVDLPSSDAELRHLALVMTDAFGSDVIAHLKSRGWIS